MQSKWDALKKQDREAAREAKGREKNETPAKDDADNNKDEATAADTKSNSKVVALRSKRDDKV